MYQSLRVSVGQLGSVLGISELINTLTLPLWGLVVDRYSRKTLLVWITGFWGLWTLAIGFVETLPQLFAVRILSSLGLGVFIPAAFSLIGDLFTDQERGRASGLMNAVGLIGAMTAFVILPLLAANGSEAWRIGFVVMGLASFGTGLLLWFLLHEPLRGAAEPELASILNHRSARRYTVQWDDLLTLIRIRSWRWLLFKEMMDALGVSILYGWSFTWLDSLGLGESAVIVVSLMTLSTVGGALFFGWLSDHLERRFPKRGRTTLVWLGLIVSLPVIILLVSADSSIYLLSAFGILYGLTSTASGDSVMWPMMQGILAPELRGSGRALANMVKGIVAALTLTLSGWIADQVGVATMLLYVIPGPLFISIIAWLPVYRTYPQDWETRRQLMIQRRANL